MSDDNEKPVGFAFLDDENQQQLEPIQDEEVNKSVAEAELPPQTIEAAEKYNDMFFTKYGDCFKTPQDCEYFAMLPLSHKQRVALLRNLQRGTNNDH